MNIRRLISGTSIAQRIEIAKTAAMLILAATLLLGRGDANPLAWSDGMAAPEIQQGIMQQYVDVVYIDTTGTPIGFRFTDGDQRRVCYVMGNGGFECFRPTIVVTPQTEEKWEPGQ